MGTDDLANLLRGLNGFPVDEWMVLATFNGGSGLGYDHHVNVDDGKVRSRGLKLELEFWKNIFENEGVASSVDLACNYFVKDISEVEKVVPMLRVADLHKALRLTRHWSIATYPFLVPSMSSTTWTADKGEEKTSNFSMVKYYLPSGKVGKRRARVTWARRCC